MNAGSNHGTWNSKMTLSWFSVSCYMTGQAVYASQQMTIDLSMF